MQRLYTSDDAGHFLSPSAAINRLYLSPRDGQNRKKDRQREYNRQNYGIRQKMKIEKKNNDEHADRRSKGSLRKHQYFGKMASPVHHETPPNRNGSKNKPNNQLPHHAPKQKYQAVDSSTGKHFQWGATKQGKDANSQYYHSYTIPPGQQDSRQSEKVQRRQYKMESKGLGKIEEVTFSMDSTEPETEEKPQRNQYQLKSKGRNAFLEREGSVTNGQFITAFRKKIIERQIAEKEKVYRAYIRSSSRQSNHHEKVRLKSKMKEVLDDLYQLQKLIKK